MESKINPKFISFITTFIFIVLANILSDEFGWLMTILLLLPLLVLLSAIQSTFLINRDYLVHQTFLFKWPILRRTVYPEQVQSIKFVRIGWAQKAAVIKMKNSRNIRLGVLARTEGYDHLVRFGEGNNINVIKTKDYLTLERRK
ncbi:hypothetical protein [Halobacillus massiliensis]|uniref:hypothetical protein n=1 Tax=Halobacillus massiliensis TaxID=1926286 RepID=UPI0009E28499|nr:hypothetical protein [Halobacillus massiliensis]